MPKKEDSSSSSNPESSSSSAAPTAEELEHTRQMMLAGQGMGEYPEAEKLKPSSSSPSSNPQEIDDTSSSSSSKTAASSSSSKKRQPKKSPEPTRESDQDFIDRVVEPTAQRIADKIVSAHSSSSSTEAEPAWDTKAASQLAAYREMEKLYPENTGLANKVEKFWKDEARYGDKWEQENPGKVFNQKDEEHQEWYEAHSPKYDEDQLADARTELRLRPRLEQESRKIREEQRKEMETLRFKEEMRETAGERSAIEHDSLVKLVGMATPELLDLLGADGQRHINPETTQKIREADPVAFEILSEEGEKLRNEASELAKLSKFSKHYKPNPDLEMKLSNGETHYPHRDIFQFAVKLEDEIASLPAEESVRNGKAFMLQQDFNVRMERIQKSNLTDDRKQAAVRTLHNTHWTLGPKQLSEALVERRADNVRKQLDRINRFSEKRSGVGGSSSSSVSASSSSAKSEEENSPSGARKKPESVSTATGSDIANNNGSRSNLGPLTDDQFVKSQFDD